MTAVESLDALRQARGHTVDVAPGEIEIADLPPDEPEPVVTDGRNGGVLTLVEYILKAPRRLDRRIRDAALQPTLIPQFLMISLIAFALFGVALSVVLASARVAPQLTAIDECLNGPLMSAKLVQFQPIDRFATFWTSGGAWQLIAAYGFGLIAATGVCLPSLYFYGLLSGIRLSMLDVVAHAMKSKATSAVALMGILPIYIALALGVMVF